MILRIVGLIGGVSWHSTAEYYRLLNQRVSSTCGPTHSARLFISSINFSDLLLWQKKENAQILVENFIAEGRKLKAAGCEGFLIASHTLTWLGDLIEFETGMKHLSLFEALIRRLKTMEIHKIGLTGTSYTMKDKRYRDKYQAAGFEVLIPREPHLTQVSTIVYRELVRGTFRHESRNAFQNCFADLIAQGAEAILLGCTEIGLLITERQATAPDSALPSTVPLIDLIETHVDECCEWILDAQGTTVKTSRPSC